MNLSIPNDITAGQPMEAAKLDENFKKIAQVINGGLDDTNINPLNPLGSNSLGSSSVIEDKLAVHAVSLGKLAIGPDGLVVGVSDQPSAYLDLTLAAGFVYQTVTGFKFKTYTPKANCTIFFTGHAAVSREAMVIGTVKLRLNAKDTGTGQDCVALTVSTAVGDKDYGWVSSNFAMCGAFDLIQNTTYTFQLEVASSIAGKIRVSNGPDYNIGAFILPR